MIAPPKVWEIRSSIAKDLAAASPLALQDLPRNFCLQTSDDRPSSDPHRTYLAPSTTLLRSDLKKLLNLGPTIIITDDLHSKHEGWSSHVNNPNGRILKSLIDTLQFDLIYILRPTHYLKNRNCRPDMLYFVLLKNVSLTIRSIEVHDDQLDSDHYLVVLQLRALSRSQVTKTITDWKQVTERTHSIELPVLDHIPDDKHHP